jgi:hypothetical protein
MCPAVGRSSRHAADPKADHGAEAGQRRLADFGLAEIDSMIADLSQPV